ncbi:MAG: zinc-dependent metalloprotease [Oligoflexales bacterium]
MRYYRYALFMVTYLYSSLLYGVHFNIPKTFIESHKQYIHTAVVISAQDHNGLHQVGSNSSLASGVNHRLSFQIENKFLSIYEHTSKPSSHRAPALRYAIKEEHDDSIIIDLSSELLGSPYHTMMSQFLRANWVSLVQSHVIDTPILEEDFISFTMEEIFIPHFQTANNRIDNRTGHPVSIQVQHSFLRVDNREYQAEEYTAFDQNMFGFFTTQAHKKTFINRHDLSHERSITYHVDEELMKRFSFEVKQAFKAWNEAFKKAIPHRNSNVLNISTKEHSHGDPRYSSLTLVQENGGNLAGFGPSIVDTTGEIISGHAYIWEQAIANSRQRAGDLYDLYHGKNINNYFEHPIESILEDETKNTFHFEKMDLDNFFKETQPHPTRPSLEDSTSKDDLQWPWISEETQHYFIAEKKSNHSEHTCKYQNAPTIFQSTASAKKFFDFFKNYSKEEVLNEYQSRMVTQLILHEIGHTLGLTHNFYGTYDSDNFSTPKNEEPKSFYNSSSVMDYSQAFDNLHFAVGPYDVAALKYGYNHLLEKKDANGNKENISKNDFFISIEKKQEEHMDSLSYQTASELVLQELGITPYLYCMMPSPSDPRCQAFSKGTQYHEIAQNAVDNYELSAIQLVYHKGQSPQAMPSLSRSLNTLHMILNQFYIHGYRNAFKDNGSGSLNDFMQAISISLKFMFRVLNTAEPGDYHLQDDKIWIRGQGKESDTKIHLPLGPARFLYPDILQNPRGETQILHSGSERHKIEVLEILTRKTPMGKSFMNLDSMFNGILSHLFSMIIRGEWITSLPTEKLTDQVHAYSYEPSENTKHYAIFPSKSQNIQNWATTLAVSRFFSSPQEFESLIDFRVKGEDKIYRGTQLETIQFPSSTRSVKYVVPQNRNKDSIAYAIASKIKSIMENIKKLDTIKNNALKKVDEINRLLEETNTLNTEENEGVEDYNKDKERKENHKNYEAQKNQIQATIKLLNRKTNQLRNMIQNEEQKMLFIQRIFQKITGLKL